MKTPEQIYKKIAKRSYKFGPPEDGIRSGYLETGIVQSMIVQAIEADRAQRNPFPKDTEHVQAVIGGIVFISEDGTQVLILADDLDAQGGAYIVSLMDRFKTGTPNTVSGNVDGWETGWEA